MIHAMRWTLPKIEQRLRLIEPLVYRRRATLPAWRASELAGEEARQALGSAVDTGDWEVIEPESHWGRGATNYVLRTTFAVPEHWPLDVPCALFLPLGEMGDFSHPETLLYVDGEAYAASNRHHQEVLLRADWLDGAEHTLAMTVWTGLGGGDLLGLLARTVHPSKEFASLVSVN